MRIAYSLGSVLTIEQLLKCSTMLSKNEPDVVWIPETWGMENFSILSAISQRLKTSKIGSSIINIYSRSPALIAMGAATIDSISQGRLILGLGTSSIPIVENFHGNAFEKPVLRMREYIQIIQKVLSGELVNYNGKIFSLKNFSLLIKPPRKKIPIYLAAVNPKMVNLCWELGDGVIFYLRPLNELKNIIIKKQAEKNIDVTCQIITCIDSDVEKAKERAKKTLAFYVSVGEIYRKFLANNGFQEETENILEEYKKTGLESNYKLVSESMLNELTISGEPQECLKQLKKFRQVGVDLPIIQFNPVGDVLGSFELLIKTISEES